MCPLLGWRCKADVHIMYLRSTDCAGSIPLERNELGHMHARLLFYVPGLTACMHRRCSPLYEIIRGILFPVTTAS